jgi:hypothetical protein
LKAHLTSTIKNCHIESRRFSLSCPSHFRALFMEYIAIYRVKRYHTWERVWDLSYINVSKIRGLPIDFQWLRLRRSTCLRDLLRSGLEEIERYWGWFEY